MQDPKSVALALSGGGTVLDVLGTYQQGRGASDLAQINARAANQDARLALERGRFEESRINRLKGQIIGQQRTSFAGQGVALGEGTPLAVQQDTERQAALDVLRARNDAALEALGYRTQASGYKYQSRLARRGSRAGGLGKLVAGAADYYALGKKLGVGDGAFGLPGED